MRILATLALLGTLGVNALAVRLPLGGLTTGELSALYPNLFVPAGITFSIWGVIYLLLGGWAAGQFLSRWEETGRALAPWFALSSVLNGGWLFAWHFQQVLLSVLVMIALLGVLLVVHARLLRLEEGGIPAPLLARAAFGVYLGWIFVALIANVTALLVAMGWGGLGLSDAVWAVAMVLVGGAVGAFATLRLGNAWVAGAMAWAFLGIILARLPEHPGIAGVAGAMIVVVGWAGWKAA